MTKGPVDQERRNSQSDKKCNKNRRNNREREREEYKVMVQRENERTAKRAKEK